MAVCELREVFPILEGPNGGGLGLTQVSGIGQAVSSLSGGSNGPGGGLVAFSFQDVSGNLTLPIVGPNGALIVSSGNPGIPIRARGQLDCGNATSGVILVTGSQISLTPGKSYSPVSVVVSCFRETLAQIIWNNNGVDNILDDILLGPGQYTCQISLPGDAFTAGTGTQAVEVRARNTTNAASAIRASLVVNELPI